jgi:hypothetical protein
LLKLCLLASKATFRPPTIRILQLVLLKFMRNIFALCAKYAYKSCFMMNSMSAKHFYIGPSAQDKHGRSRHTPHL